MRRKLYFVNQLLLVLLFAYYMMLPTFLVDYFPWGNSNNDGLYMLVIPIVFYPLIIFFAVVKYLIVRKRLIRRISKRSTFFQMLLPIIAGIAAMGGGSNEALLLSSITTLVAIAYVIWESYTIYIDAKVGEYWKS